MPAAEAAMEAFTDGRVAGLRSAREELGLAAGRGGQGDPGGVAARARPRRWPSRPGASASCAGCEHRRRSSRPGRAARGALRVDRGAGRQGHAGSGGTRRRGARGRAAGEQGRARRTTRRRKRGRKLENQGFVAKAPEAVVAEERAVWRAAEAVLAEIAPALPGARGRTAAAARGVKPVSTVRADGGLGVRRRPGEAGHAAWVWSGCEKLVEALGSTRRRPTAPSTWWAPTARRRPPGSSPRCCRQHGHKVGAYTSPHLISLAERQMVDSVAVDRRGVLRADGAHQAGGGRGGEDLRTDGEFLTQFEVLTAAAFLYFKEQGCDVAVIEAGLGGRLDATAVISSDVQVLTSIGREHTELLGDTPLGHPERRRRRSSRRAARWWPGVLAPDLQGRAQGVLRRAGGRLPFLRRRRGRPRRSRGESLRRVRRSTTATRTSASRCWAATSGSTPRSLWRRWSSSLGASWMSTGCAGPRDHRGPGPARGHQHSSRCASSTARTTRPAWKRRCAPWTISSSGGVSSPWCRSCGTRTPSR